MKEFTTKSGARIVINLAPWKDAKELKKVIESFAASEKISFSDIKAQANDLTAMLLRIDGSDLFDRAIWPCLNRCLRNDQKITESIFDDGEARKDYYEILVACVRENLGPLVESLFSQFAGMLQKMPQKDSQKP